MIRQLGPLKGGVLAALWPALISGFAYAILVGRSHRPHLHKLQGVSAYAFTASAFPRATYPRRRRAGAASAAGASAASAAGSSALPSMPTHSTTSKTGV